jgi:adenosine kinase
MTGEEIRDAVSFVVVTCGECGSDVWVKEKKYRIESIPPENIADPTGVGDAFRAGFVRGKRLGFDWQTCGQMGSLAATYCLEKRGTQNHRYSRVEFVQRYRKHFNDKGALDALIEE